jgi:hypothetical protein
MKYILLITLSIIFTVWLFDITPMTTNTTAYHAKCNGGLVTYDNCHGDLSIGETYTFAISSHRNDVLSITANALPVSLGKCSITDRKNWSCQKQGFNGKIDFYWMSNSLYVHNKIGKETALPTDNTLPVLRKEWVKLYVLSIPNRILSWFKNSKEEHFQRKIQDITSEPSN